MTKSKPTVLAVELVLAMSNDDLAEQMRTLKAVREAGRTDHVVCCITGFDDDPRELADIPEARAFCRRLVDTGFISYLDVFSSLAPDSDIAELVRTGLGAGEVWLIAEGRWQPSLPITRALLDEVCDVLTNANGVADAAVGRFNTGR